MTHTHMARGGGGRDRRPEKPHADVGCRTVGFMDSSAWWLVVHVPEAICARVVVVVRWQQSGVANISGAQGLVLRGRRIARCCPREKGQKHVGMHALLRCIHADEATAAASKNCAPSERCFLLANFIAWPASGAASSGRYTA